jgi:arsenate reductase (thioredoxin)
MGDTKRILVVCTGNRCRSQMAHGWLQHFAPDHVEVRSAGTAPKGVHPLSIEVMGAAGVDITSHTSDHIDEFSDTHFDVVVTVCNNAKETCPVFTNTDKLVHRSFEEPDHEDMGREELIPIFNRIRDEIRDWAKEFVLTV